MNFTIMKMYQEASGERRHLRIIENYILYRIIRNQFAIIN